MASETLTLIIKGEDQTGGAVQSARGGLAGLGKVAVGIAAGGLAIAATAAAGLAAGLANCVGEAMAAEQVSAALGAVLAQTGGVTGVTAQMANDLATQWAGLTMFDDEDILGGEAVLARFREIGSATFPAATDAMLDLATAMGTDAQTAATTLGKALASPGEGLLRLKAAGVVFTDEEAKMLQQMTDTGQTAEAQAIILDRLNQSIGGAAEAAGATAQGQWTIFNNQINNIKESLGEALLPALTSIGTALTTALQKPEVQAAVTQLATSLGQLASEALPPLIDFLTNTAIPAMITLAQVLGGGGAGSGLGQAFSDVAAFVKPVTDALGPLAEAATGLWNVVAPLLIPALQTIGDIVTTVIVPALGDQFINLLTTVTEALTGFLTFLTGAVEMIVGLFTGDMDQARAGAQTVMDGITQIFNAMATGILASVTNVVALIIGAFEQLGIDIVTPVEAVITAISDTFAALPEKMVTLGEDILNGIKAGFDNALKSVTDAAAGVVTDIWNAMTGQAQAQSPSRLTAQLGVWLGQGLIQGMQSVQGAVSNTAKTLINDTFKTWYSSLKSQLGSSGASNIRRLFQDWMRDWLATATAGVSETTGDLVARMLRDAAEAFGPGVASILQQFGGSWQSLLGSVGSLPASGNLFSIVDSLMSGAGVLGNLGSAAASRYEQKILEPLREQLRILEEQGGELNEIARLKERIAAGEKRIADLQQQQADLQWLNAQLDLVKMIKENGLNASAILGDMALGLGADPAAIMDAMTAAMQEMIQQAQATFPAFGVQLAQWIPDYLVPGSPTKFEMGLRGIGRALESIQLPPLLTPAYAYAGAAAGARAGGTTVQINYSPVFSAVDQREAEYKIRPLVEAALRKLQ